MSRDPQPSDQPESATEIADAVRAKRVSAAEILERSLARIEALNPELKAFVFLDQDGARRRAREIDVEIQRGNDPGPLAGVPFGVKDSEACAGMPASMGSLFYKDGPPAAADAASVARLRRAGAIPIGKTAAPEFDLHSVTWSLAWGATRNPWDKRRSPGGSSGGSSAAVASGMVPLATAADAAGSTRSPAAFTGMVGLKPSQGRVGREGASDVEAKGCISSTVRDTALFFDVVSGPTTADRTSLPSPDVRYEALIDTLDVAGLKAVWSDDLGFVPTEPECIRVAREAAEVLVREAKLQWVDRRFEIPNAYAPWVAANVIRLRGELELDGIWPDQIDRLTPRVRWRAAMADSYGLKDMAQSHRARAEVEAQAASFFAEVDLLLTPVTAVVSLPAEGPVPKEIAGRDARWTGAEAHLPLANFTWQPAISVPAGRSADGFPIGLQVVCPRWRDDIAMRLARILEVVRPWPRVAPGCINRVVEQSNAATREHFKGGHGGRDRT